MKRSKFIQQSKKQLSRESNLNHLLGRLAPRPRCHVTKALSGKINITILKVIFSVKFKW